MSTSTSDNGAPPPAASGRPAPTAALETPVMDRKAFDRILIFGVERGISDVHFEVGHPPHLRLQGDLLPAKYASLRSEDTEAVAEILLGNDFPKFRDERMERDVTYSIEGVSRFRASLFWQRGQVGVVLRVVPLSIRNFDQLNLPATLDDLCVTRRGLILITGPTGMGKSTTIAAMVQRINQTRRAHIVTVEDPIEFLYPKDKSLVIQREVGTDTASFRKALVAALRQDPDVIMLGEVRDAETAEICLKAAETGHLVLTAIHTQDAVRTVQRVVGMFPPADAESTRMRLADTLKAVVSLRLLPSVDNQSRVPAVEILRVTRTIQDCIRAPERLAEIPRHIGKGRDLYGMQTFDQHLLELYQAKRITLEIAKLAATNPEDLERSITLED